MRKKLLAITTVCALAMTSVVGCGNTTTTEETTGSSDSTTAVSGDTTDTTADGDSTGSTTTASAKLECPDTSDWTEADKIYCYSWNDEFGSRLAYVIGSTDAAGNTLADGIDGAYPELAKYVEYVNLGVSGTDGSYQEAIDTLIENNDEKFPSVIAMDNDVAKYYLEDDVTLSMESIGITSEMYANAYDFSTQYATYNGELKGLTWQACPGNLTYRYDIAEEVLGSGEPEDVQEYVKDWDSFFETADKMKEAGYKMTSGADEIKYACFDQQTQPWITVADDGTETLTLDSSVTDFFELSKQLYDGDYTNNEAMWSEGWSASYEGDVFCYFGCTWAVYWCMAFNGEEDSTYGNWRVTEGPVSYHWGGTYVGVVDGCPNTELAAFLIYSLCCDEDIMYTLACDTLDFVNNKAVIDKEIANGDGASEILGGQNPVATWAEAAPGIDLSNASYLDSELKNYITDAAAAYNEGTLDSVDAALDYVKDQVKANYDYITVE